MLAFRPARYLRQVNIALFPLQLVAFPYEQVALHIFEVRYRAMVAECEAGGTPFGLVAVHEGKVATTGTLMAITQVVNRYDDGRLDLRAMGTQPFWVERFIVSDDSDLAHRAEVEVLQVEESAEFMLRQQVLEAYHTFHRLIGHDSPPTPDTDRPLSYQIAHLTALSIPQKIELLGIREERARLNKLLRHLVALNPTLEMVENVRQKIRQNGAFKALPGAEFELSNFK